MKVKFCGITRPKDYLEAIHLGADFVGFIFYSRSPRYLDATKQVAMKREIESTEFHKIKRVGVFVNEEINSIVGLVKEMSLDVVQVHGDESLTYFNQLKKVLEDLVAENTLTKKIAIWKCLKLDEGGSNEKGFNRKVNLVDYPTDWFLLERLSESTKKKFVQIYGGTGKTIGEKPLLDFLRQAGLDATVEDQFKFILAGGLTSKNLSERIAVWRKSEASLPQVLDFNSGVEESPGVKSHNLMADVVKVVGEVLREVR